MAAVIVVVTSVNTDIAIDSIVNTAAGVMIRTIRCFMKQSD